MRAPTNVSCAYMIIVAGAADNVCGAKKIMWSKIASHVKGIVHNFFFYCSNLIFWIVMGCGIADLGRRGL